MSTLQTSVPTKKSHPTTAAALQKQLAAIEAEQAQCRRKLFGSLGVLQSQSLGKRLGKQASRIAHLGRLEETRQSILAALSQRS